MARLPQNQDVMMVEGVGEAGEAMVGAEGVAGEEDEDEGEDEVEVGNGSNLNRSHIVSPPKDTPVAGAGAVAEMSTTLILFFALHSRASVLPGLL